VSIVPTQTDNVEQHTNTVSSIRVGNASATNSATNKQDTEKQDTEKQNPEQQDIEKPVKRKRRSTSHLKAVPETLAQREEIKAASEAYAADLDKSRPFTKNELEKHARILLDQLNMPEKFLGFVMVLIGNFFWKQQFLALPFHRRMLLLPHCLKHAEGCPADYDEFGLDCEKCGACSIADYKVRAEQLGYKVLVAEGSPVVLKIIVSGHIDGILGVACLNVLEKAIDKVLLAGVPSYAIPLHSGDCKNTKLDESWVWDVLEKYEPLPSPHTSSYVPLMRAANDMFDGEFERLLPRIRSRAGENHPKPIALTEQLAYDWLGNGGKRFRPFITLAAYEALIQDPAADEVTDCDHVELTDSVKRVSMAIEAFHKASLVHDDIEDDDAFRYGRETLHRQYDLGTAINVGDYLIGLGYRLVNQAREEVGAEASADIVENMAAAHVKLCDGQGAEMAWQANPDWDFTPKDALQIYALKTSPAFEAALYAGVRMAGEVGDYREMIAQFSRHLGVGFQILNDLKDWQGDEHNKLIAGQDALALRPTLLLALALQNSQQAKRAEIQELLTNEGDDFERLKRLREIFEQNNVFDTAEALVDKSRVRAEALADDVACEELRRLLYFLVDTVLAREEATPTFAEPQNLVPLQITSG